MLCANPLTPQLQLTNHEVESSVQNLRLVQPQFFAVCLRSVRGGEDEEGTSVGTQKDWSLALSP